MVIVSSAFDGVSRVNRSRMVHEVLADELGSGLHALTLTLRTPQEEESRAA
jgi:BolA protein